MSWRLLENGVISFCVIQAAVAVAAASHPALMPWYSLVGVHLAHPADQVQPEVAGMRGLRLQ